jgi:hypothetical protein
MVPWRTILIVIRSSPWWWRRTVIAAHHGRGFVKVAWAAPGRRVMLSRSVIVADRLIILSWAATVWAIARRIVRIARPTTGIMATLVAWDEGVSLTSFRRATTIVMRRRRPWWRHSAVVSKGRRLMILIHVRIIARRWRSRRKAVH